jgi:hypothetical protein
MAGKFVSQLEGLLNKLESLVQSIRSSKMQPSKLQYKTIDNLSLRLSKAAQDVQVEINALKQKHSEPFCEEGRKQLDQVRTDIEDLTTTGYLKNRGLFARNIVLFFDRPKDSIIDSSATQARKKLTRERCGSICELHPDGLISWAVAFMPTKWIANLMTKDTFDYVLDRIEPDNTVAWPQEVYHILNGLGNEEPLRGCQQYLEFLKSRGYISKS